MSTLIVYSTKTGASRVCAELLAKKIKTSSLCDLRIGMPDIRSYDTVAIGSGVRFGRLYKPAVNFIKENADALRSKTIAFYLCNADPNRLEDIIEKDIPGNLIHVSKCIMSFGGKLPFEKYRENDWLKKEYIEVFTKLIN